MNKVSGLYIIENIYNKKRYIGSSVNINNRISQHIFNLKNNRHTNKHLQSAWNKYGEQLFEFKTILICDPNMIGYFEQKCLDSFRDLYNKAMSVEHTTRGRKASAETKKKLSIARRNRPPASEETKQKISNSMKRNLEKNPERARFRLGEKQRLGQHPTPETRKKLSAWQTGKTLSEEHKKKISDSLKDIDITWSEKISETMKLRWRNNDSALHVNQCSKCGRFIKDMRSELQLCKNCEELTND